MAIQILEKEGNAGTKVLWSFRGKDYKIIIGWLYCDNLAKIDVFYLRNFGP